MKVLIIAPIWKRPEVWEVVCRNLQRFRNSVKWEVTILAVLCPFDPDLKRLERTCRRFSVHRCYFPNLPVGRKLNAGILYAMKKFEFDYLMNFGSDDLIHPAIEKIYQPAMDAGVPFFGIDSLYFRDFNTGKTFYFRCYTNGYALGGGRMIARELLEKLILEADTPYSPEVCRGMDGDSGIRIRKYCRIEDEVINAGEFPYIVDLKTDTNINHITQIEGHQSQIKYVPNNYLDEYYDI